MTRVNLLIVSTNKYLRFVEPLLRSCEMFLLKDCQLNYNIFTNHNRDDLLKAWSRQPFSNRLFIHPVIHRPWPYATLMRYHFFSTHKAAIPGADYYFYIDADCLVVAPVISANVLSDRTAVQHCGYVNERGTYETNKKSTSYVGNNEGAMYYGGGFWGFSASEFWRMVNVSTAMIDTDEKNGVVPLWHDESVLNRYLIDNPPTKILSPAYHYPQQFDHVYKKWKSRGKHYEPIILLLNKSLIGDMQGITVNDFKRD